MGRNQKHSFMFLVSFLFFSLASASPLWAPVQKSSIVICAQTGKVLSASNPDAITHPASLTKMMTLYLIFKALDAGHITLDQKIPVSKHASVQIPCKLGLKPGHMIAVRDVIMGMVTKSANDASAAIAEYFGKGCEKRFALAMTQQARKLGMIKTVFQNASGVPDPNQITTAREMAILSHALYRDFPHYFHVFKEQSFTYKGIKHNNHNHLLGKIEGVDGIKTGFVNASGCNLAASVVRDNQRIIAVVMGGASWHARDKQMVKLIEATYTTLKSNQNQQAVTYASIEDLIEHPRLQKAVYVSSQKKSPETNYQSLDELFAAIDKKPIREASVKSTLKRKHLKNHGTRQRKKGKYVERHHNDKILFTPLLSLASLYSDCDSQKCYYRSSR